MEKQFKGMKKAIVVGASSGIGMEVARLLLKQGWKVGVAARRIDLLKTIGDVETEQIDVTKPEATQQLQHLIERVGGMDLFFYASGIGKQNRELKEDIELATVETNAVGFTRMIGEAYRYFAQQGHGHIAPYRPSPVPRDWVLHRRIRLQRRCRTFICRHSSNRQTLAA